MLVLDSGAVTRLASASPRSKKVLQHVRGPLFVPSMVLVECLTGDGPRDARVNMFLSRCTVVDAIPPQLARRAAWLRARARRGSAVDALVVALAEPGGVVLTGDTGDLTALAAYADEVSVERV